MPKEFDKVPKQINLETVRGPASIFPNKKITQVKPKKLPEQ
ncbi:MAG TPA: hypothetical protein VKK79_06545 [Candidatus Lokiarchaeia archaeon]|nr:hypothetical protein [Candidatus Lokiarchaeia archaeon]